MRRLKLVVENVVVKNVIFLKLANCRNFYQNVKLFYNPTETHTFKI